jgi:hypothetical protein
MTALENVFLGVVAGVITPALGLLLVKVVLPWYRSLIYTGIDLRGSWVGEKIQSSGEKYRYDLTLDQKAHVITGSARISLTGSNHDYTLGFVVEGSIWEGFVTLTWKSTDRTRLSFAAALMKVTERGHALEGYWAYRSFNSDAVESEQIRWTRVS